MEANPIITYFLSRRRAEPGETTCPFIDWKKLRPLGTGSCYPYSSNQEPCAIWEHPMFLVHRADYPVPIGYDLVTPMGGIPSVVESYQRAYLEGQTRIQTASSASVTQNAPPRKNVLNPSPLAISSVKLPEQTNQTSQPETPKEITVSGQRDTNRRDPAYDITQCLLSSVSIRILGEAIFYHCGTHFRHITAEVLHRLIMQHCRSEIQREGNSRLIDAIYKLLIAEPKIATETEAVDENLLSFQDYILDLRTKRVLKHGSQHNTFYCLNARLVQNSHHPVFDHFLADITGGDPALYQRILEVIGYCLVPDLKGKCYFVFQGVPDSGKSLLASFIRRCFAAESTTALDILSLGERFSAAELIGRQLCLCMDLPSSALSSKTVSAFKMLTGGDLITADVKYRPHITFLNRAKFLLGTNHPILTQNADPAFYRRAVVVPFLHTIPKERQDVHLLEKLEGERDAIIHDALMAYFALRENHYRFTGDWQLNDQFYSSDLSASPSIDDLLERFVLTECDFADDSTELVCFVGDLYARFDELNPGLIAENQFSKAILQCCKRIGADTVERIQKGRREGVKNPQSRLKGIALRKL